MQFYYVVMYDSDTKSWGIVDEVESYMPDGNVWDHDTSDQTMFGWFWPDADNYPEANLIDERAYTMLRTLASIWPEVDHVG